MKRRSFVKHSAIAGIALGLYPSCSRKSSIETKKKLGVALLGLGSYSTNNLAPALQLTQHCELRGIVTGSPDKIPDWQAKYNIPDDNIYSYNTLDQISNNDDIDVVYIVTPTGTHAKYAIAAANAGKHVWCEKPMAMTVTECQSIIDACAKNKVKLSIGYRMQHEPNTKTLISYRDTMPYGRMTNVEAMAGYPGGTWGTGWRFDRELGGGALYDMGVYTVNALRYATGMEPIAVFDAQQFTTLPDTFTETDETSDYYLEFPNGLIGHGRTSMNEDINHLRVDCDKGWYELRPMQSYNGVVGSTSDGVQLDTFVPNQQAIQMDDDALTILNNEAVMVPGIEGLKDIAIIQAIIKSAEMNGARVAL